MYGDVFTVGIVLTGTLLGNNATVPGNVLNAYSYVIPDNQTVLTRCSTGLGPSGTDDNSAVGGLYFNGSRVSNSLCSSSSRYVQPNPAGIAGVIDILQCAAKTFSIVEEGIYTCIMMNSSMINESISFGVYFAGRSELHTLIYIYIPSFILLHSCSSNRHSIT